MRHIKDVTIKAKNRDEGKVFRVTEMPAEQSEKWAMKAFLALSQSGTEIPDNLDKAGLAGIAVLGLKALGGMKTEMAEVLMDEMFECIRYVPDPKTLPDFVRPPIGDDIEEVSTRLSLRQEVFELHTGFSLAAVTSQLTAAS